MFIYDPFSWRNIRAISCSKCVKSTHQLSDKNRKVLFRPYELCAKRNPTEISDCRLCGRSAGRCYLYVFFFFLPTIYRHIFKSTRFRTVFYAAKKNCNNRGRRTTHLCLQSVRHVEIRLCSSWCEFRIIYDELDAMWVTRWSMINGI